MKQWRGLAIGTNLILCLTGLSLGGPSILSYSPTNLFSLLTLKVFT